MKKLWMLSVVVLMLVASPSFAEEAEGIPSIGEQPSVQADVNHAVNALGLDAGRVQAAAQADPGVIADIQKAFKTINQCIADREALQNGLIGQ